MIRSALRPIAVADSGLTTPAVAVHRGPCAAMSPKMRKTAVSSDARRRFTRAPIVGHSDIGSAVVAAAPGPKLNACRRGPQGLPRAAYIYDDAGPTGQRVRAEHHPPTLAVVVVAVGQPRWMLDARERPAHPRSAASSTISLADLPVNSACNHSQNSRNSIFPGPCAFYVVIFAYCDRCLKTIKSSRPISRATPMLASDLPLNQRRSVPWTIIRG